MSREGRAGVRVVWSAPDAQLGINRCVTHDQVATMAMGDRVAVMRNDVIVQCDSPIAVYDQPAPAELSGLRGRPARAGVRAETVAAL